MAIGTQSITIPISNSQLATPFTGIKANSWGYYLAQDQTNKGVALTVSTNTPYFYCATKVSGTELYNYSLFPKITAVSGTWVVNSDANNYPYGANLKVNVPAINDAFSFLVYLDIGSYNINFLSYNYPGAGIVTLQVDGASVGTVDLYDAGGTYNNIGSVAITIAAAGTKTIKFLCATKNPSSSDYAMLINDVLIERTA